MSNEADDANTIFKITKGSIGKNNGGKVAWSKDHNTKLLELVNNYRGKCWKRVAKEMQEEFNDPELTAKKCRERWCNCTNPDIDKTALTESEELFLLIYHHEYKNKWVLISRHLPRRNSSKLKNNFSSLIRKIARKISLNEREVVLSANVYIQIIYASVLIYDLASIEDSPEKAIIIAPIHIYDHIKGKRRFVSTFKSYLAPIPSARAWAESRMAPCSLQSALCRNVNTGSCTPTLQNITVIWDSATSILDKCCTIWL